MNRKPTIAAVVEEDLAQDVALAPAQLLGALHGADGHDRQAQVLEAVHALGAGVGHVATEHVRGHDAGLVHGVGEDRVDVRLAGRPVGCLDDVAGGPDRRARSSAGGRRP